MNPVLENIIQRNNAINDIWYKRYDHFRKRLNERYRIDITFKQYMGLLKERVDVIGHIKNGKKIIGFLPIQGQNVLVVKEVKRDKALVTCMNPEHCKLLNK